MYSLWETSHPINQKVMQSFKYGMALISEYGDYPLKHIDRWKGERNNISYGILRGTEKIFKASNEYWEIDRGYFHPGHFEGYYRISRNGTRAKYNDAIARALPNDRLEALNLKIKPWQDNPKGYVLVCPPTELVREFFDVPEDWVGMVKQRFPNHRLVLRGKDASQIHLRDALKGAYCVVTYNSNVAIEALMEGVPVVADSPDIIAWLDATEKACPDRELLFRFLSYCQFTLAEIQTGKPWQICQSIQKYGEVPVV